MNKLGQDIQFEIYTALILSLYSDKLQHLNAAHSKYCIVTRAKWNSNSSQLQGQKNWRLKANLRHIEENPL